MPVLAILLRTSWVDVENRSLHLAMDLLDLFEAVLDNKRLKILQEPLQNQLHSILSSLLICFVHGKHFKASMPWVVREQIRWQILIQRAEKPPYTKIGYDHANRGEDMSSSGLFRSTGQFARAPELLFCHFLLGLDCGLCNMDGC